MFLFASDAPSPRFVVHETEQLCLVCHEPWRRNDPATWQGGVVPAASSNAIVRHTVTVTANADVWSVTVEPTAGNLIVQAGVVLTVLH